MIDEELLINLLEVDTEEEWQDENWEDSDTIYNEDTF